MKFFDVDFFSSNSVAIRGRAPGRHSSFHPVLPIDNKGVCCGCVGCDQSGRQLVEVHSPGGGVEIGVGLKEKCDRTRRERVSPTHSIIY